MSKIPDTKCPACGQAIYRHKLSDDDVRAIRARKAAGETTADLAKAFSVNVVMIRHAINGRLRFRFID